MASSAIDSFCVAKARLARLEEECSKEKRPDTARIDAIRSQLKQYMQDYKEKCLSVDVREGDPGAGVTRKYLRFQKSSTIGALSADGIEKAVMSVTPADLKVEYQNLTQKMTTSKNKKTKRKRDDKGDDNPDEASSSTGNTISMLEVWNSILEGRIRGEHLKNSETLEISHTCGRKTSKVDPSKDVKRAPDPVRALVQEWLDLQNKVQQVVEKMEEKVTEAQNTIKQQEPVVKQYLERTYPEKQSQEVNLNYKNQSCSYLLVKKESCTHRPVRITAFKPHITASISHVLGRHPDTSKSFEQCCSDRVKNELVNALRHKFVQFEEENKQVRQYVSLDKVPHRQE